ncbi:unnamed protein product [Lactuca saligna]|uniref:Uncharacterized protein n=1 Tax=Lactuca saligna TaxID=75948 RepID=A0AA35VM38_LACSI|nr:unnamed protein product [Lactuca saligna]
MYIIWIQTSIRTPEIPVELSDKDTNFNTDEGVQKNESSITYTFEASTIISSIIENSTVATSTTLPQISSPLTTSVPVSTISPTYSTIMHEPITTLFSSQSTEAEIMIHEEEPNDDEIMDLVEGIEHKQFERLALHSKSFDYEIHKFRNGTKERHELFVEQVTKVKEFVDLNVVEFKSELSKEVQKMEQNYTLLHSKVDVIVTAITKLVEFNTEYSNKLEAKSKKGFSGVSKDGRIFIQYQGVYFEI